MEKANSKNQSKYRTKGTKALGIITSDCKAAKNQTYKTSTCNGKDDPSRLTSYHLNTLQ